MRYLDVLVVISPARGGDFEINVASEAGNARTNYVMSLVYTDGLAGSAVNEPPAVPFMRVASRGVPTLDAANPEVVVDARLSKACFAKAAELGDLAAGR